MIKSNFLFSIFFTFLSILFSIALLFIFLWFYYSNIMIMYKPYINVKSQIDEPLSFFESFKLFAYLKLNKKFN